MRVARPLIAVLALLVLSLLPLAATTALSTASAAPAGTQSSHPADLKVSAHVRQVGSRLFIRGFVRYDQEHPGTGSVVIADSRRCNERTGTCDFHRYRKVRLVEGRYQVKVFAPRTGNLYWQAHLGRHRSDIWITCITTTGSCT